MGCDIHSYAETRKGDKWEKVGDVFPLDDFDKEWYGKDKGEEPFSWRSYAIFGFLANVRNYSHCSPISTPRGLPRDVSAVVKAESDSWGSDGHSHSWLSVRELLEYDYEQVFWNRRVTKEVAPRCFDGAALAEVGEGQHITYREHLREAFFDVLDELEKLGKPDNVRVVFWFDS